MKNIPKILCLFVFLPLVVGVETDNRDSSETNLRIAGGLGSYANITRGCGGEILEKERIPFKDAGFSIDHKFKSPLKIGLRTGYISERQIWYSHTLPTPTEENRENFYVNPDISLEDEEFGIGVGPFFAQKTLYGRERQVWGKTLPSAHFRFGIKKFYFSANLLENVPLYSGGGYLNFGLGTSLNSFSFWAGVGTQGPYDSWGFVAKSNLKLHRNLYLDLHGRLGQAGGISESAVSMGINYKIFGKSKKEF